MDKDLHARCPQCESGASRHDLFCPVCGRLSPSVVTRGSLAVEVAEIPSAEIRSEVQTALRSWFPGMDSLKAGERLKWKPSVLVSGIDEVSGRRILDALKAWKVNGRLIREADTGRELDWKRLILNPGLAVSVIALLFAMLIGGVTGMLLLLVAIAAPPVAGLLRRKDAQPLVPPWALFSTDHHWIAIAEDYARVVPELEPLDREMLREIASEVFQVVAELKSGSVAAVSAGGEEGDLYHGMRDSVRRAIALAREIDSAPEAEESTARQELTTLLDLIKKTGDWFRTLRHGATKPTAELSEQLRDVTESIDRIVQDVRSTREDRVLPREKTTT